MSQGNKGEIKKQEFLQQFIYELLLFYYYSFIHMCIHCLGHFSPLPSSTLPLSGRTCSALLSNFVEEKT
jgi:hypothetical protein